MKVVIGGKTLDRRRGDAAGRTRPFTRVRLMMVLLMEVGNLLDERKKVAGRRGRRRAAVVGQTRFLRHRQRGRRERIMLLLLLLLLWIGG